MEENSATFGTLINIDGFVNLLCMYLQYSFTKKYYERFCCEMGGWCRNREQNQSALPREMQGILMCHHWYHRHRIRVMDRIEVDYRYDLSRIVSVRRERAED